jgi:hypothetical protein
MGKLSKVEKNFGSVLATLASSSSCVQKRIPPRFGASFIAGAERVR